MNNRGAMLQPFSVLATTVPAGEKLSTMLIQTIVLGLVAFFISGGLLVAFWRSLEDEVEGGPSRLGPKSKRLLVALIVSLVFFGVIFMTLGLKQ